MSLVIVPRIVRNCVLAFQLIFDNHKILIDYIHSATGDLYRTQYYSEVKVMGSRAKSHESKCLLCHSLALHLE